MLKKTAAINSKVMVLSTTLKGSKTILRKEILRWIRLTLVVTTEPAGLFLVCSTNVLKRRGMFVVPGEKYSEDPSDSPDAFLVLSMTLKGLLKTSGYITSGGLCILCLYSGGKF